MKSQYDVVVIGGGPAGCVAARRAAEAGFDTLLVEKRQEIGAPVRCAEAIGVEMSQPFIQPDPKWIDASISFYSIYNSCGERVSLPPAEPTIVVNRKVFDVALALKAVQAGAEIRAAAAAVGLSMEGRQVCGVKVESFGKVMDIKARLVVAADGTESQSARWAGLKASTALVDYYAAFEYYLAGVHTAIDPSMCEYHLDKNLAPGGYLWVFPKGEDTANVGLVVTADQLPGESLRGKLDQFISQRFPGASVISAIAGGIPVTGAVKPMGCDGLVAVGDAAHQADPLSGGGINWGMIGADLAMQAAVPALLSSDVSWKRLREYERLWQERCGKMHAALYKIRKIITKLDQSRLDGLVRTAAALPISEMSLGQVMLSILKNDPLLLFEARTLISTGLILK